MGVTLLLSLAALIVAAITVWLVLRLNQRLGQAFGDSSGNLEASLGQYHQKIKQVDEKLEKLNKIHQELSDRAALASQKISIVRFNPFGDTGGDQSFALAVLDNHNSGYVLTSIHSRTGSRVYVKPIDFGKSKYNLSTEEQKALVLATKRTPTKEAV
jgi:hypothetical protein